MMHSPNEMARAGCTTLRGIRLWEEEGLLGDVARSAGGTRRYTAEQMDAARIVAAGQFGGWSIDEIRSMLTEWGPEVYEALCVRLTDQTKAAVRLIEALPKPATTVQDFDL